MKTTRMTAAMLLALVWLAAAAGCGDEEPQAPTAATAATDAIVTTATATSTGFEQAEVTLEDIQFNPGETTIKVGETVSWANEDSVSHTVTSDDDLFDSGPLREGDDFSFTFEEPGTYPYTCTVHPTVMTGTVVVEE